MGLLDNIMGAAQREQRGLFDVSGMGNFPPAQIAEAPQQEKRGGVFGSDYSGEDLITMLLRAAAIAQGDYGGAAQLGSNIGAKARAEAEAAAAERQRQIERQEGNQDYETRKGIDQRYRDPGQPYRFEDNAGNVWERGPDGENRRIFTDLAPRQFMQDGQLIQVPNPFAPSGGQETGDAPVIEDGYAYTPGPGGKANQSNWKPVGGGASNGTGGFRP